MPDILMLKYKNGYQFTCRRSIAEHRNFGQRKTVVRPRRFKLVKTGSGTGTLTSSPTGIDCGATCSATFTPSSVVTLTATPASGSTFGCWFGACTGTASTCTVTLNQASSVNASFSAPAVTTYQYDANGNLTQITDPLGRIRQTQYDTLNQAVRQLQPHPSLIGSTLGQIDTTYDSLGQVTRITDPRNLSTDYAMDSLGNLHKQTSPDTGITLAAQDPAGNLATRTDARGKTASYNYDSLNRVSQIVYDDQTVNYSWDNCINGIGRLCSLSNNNSNVSYRYDSHGRITGKTQSAGASLLTVSHTYNAAGQRIGSLSPGAQSIEYQWIGQHITAITSNGQPVISQITYEPDGQINGWTWGNNQQNERFYDLAGRIAIVSMGVDAQTQLQDSRYYGYDAAGRLIDEIDDTDPNLNQRHEYDELDRLIGSRRGEPSLSRIDYSYDLSGNRTGKIKDSTTLYSYSTDANSNQLQSQGGAQTVSYSYDPMGNLIGDGRFSHSYNSAGRRIATTDTVTGQTISYGYDAIGQRITKTNGGNTTQYFYDEQGHLIGEYDATGQLIQEIIWLGDLPVAVLKPTIPASATTDIYYIHADHLGTPRKITRPNDSKVVWTWESEAFGNSLPDQNPSGLGDFVFNLRFPGQYYDQETGLFYNYFRDYDPAKGRYIESDPIGLSGGINTYAYVGGSPVNYIDPTGEIKADPRTAILWCLLHPKQCTEYAKKGIEKAWDGCKWVYKKAKSDDRDGASKLEDLTGMSRNQANETLRNGGFEHKGTTAGGYEKYYHPDGSRVQIRPNGEVVRTGPKVQSTNPNESGYRPRIGPDGKPTTFHNTGEFVE